MKKVFLGLILILLLTTQAFAAGTVTVVKERVYVMGETARIFVTITWTADASNATVPNTTINAVGYGLTGWYLYSIETNPGSPSPTPSYGIKLLDTDGADISSSFIMARDASNTEIEYLKPYCPVVRGDLTFTLSYNSVNSATGTVTLVFVPEAF
jgi:hypothetical protein